MRKKISKLLVLCLMLVMAITATVMPALAFTYTPVSGGTTSFYKDLVMPASASVPSATFNFAIAPGTAVAGSTGTAPISAGIGSPTITSSVSFSSSDSTTAGVPGNSSATGSKYARKSVSVNFSSVSFPAPGIYRYVVTESGTNAGITNDSSTTRYLDVYVTDNETNNTLVVSKYVLHKGDASVKSSGFQNTYNPVNLTLSKAVTGNQGSREKYFKFVVTISNATAGSVYTVNLSNADSTVPSNNSTLAAYSGSTNPATLTVASGATSVAGTFYLQDGQSITISGLRPGVKYAITETNEDYNPSYKINSGSATNGASISATTINSNTTVAYTNRRAGTVPTGVALSAIPGAVMMLSGVLAAFTLKKKERE